MISRPRLEVELAEDWGTVLIYFPGLFGHGSVFCMRGCFFFATLGYHIVILVLLHRGIIAPVCYGRPANETKLPNQAKFACVRQSSHSNIQHALHLVVWLNANKRIAKL